MSNTFNASVPRFKPSKHGFRFTNSFQLKDLPLGDKIEEQINQAGYGLCGGMSHCVHELFNFKQPIPTTSTPPKAKTPLHTYLTESLLESFGPRLRDMKKILKWYAMPNGTTRLPKLTIGQLMALKLQLKRRKLVQLMICYNTESNGNQWDNHQVLAYKITEKNGKGTIWLYEPNNPKNDNARIEYTSDSKGVHMQEFDFKTRAKAADSKTIHGFFLVAPRLENPLSQPSYLLFKGHQFFVNRMRKNLRKSIYEITSGLVKYTKLTPLEIIKLLKNSGYNATDIARVSKDVLKISADLVINLLFKVQFTAGQIAAALNIVYNKTAAWLLPKLLRLGYKAVDVALGIQHHFRMQLVDLVKALKKAGVKLATIVILMQRNFRISNMRTLARMLKAARYGTDDIIKELKSAGLSIKDAIIILRNEFRTSVLSTTRLVRKHFGNKAKDILITLWRHGNAGVGDMISVAKKVFGWGKWKLLKLI